MGLSIKTSDAYSKEACKITCDFEKLKNAPIFKDADAEVLKLFAYLSERRKYNPGDHIITEKEDADAAYYLVSGSADVTTTYKNKEVRLQQLHQDTHFGELALLAHFKWFFNVRTETHCEVIIISRKSFQKVLKSFPDKREKMVEKIIQLRVDKFVEQTNFMLDNLPEEYLRQSVWSPSNL